MKTQCYTLSFALSLMLGALSASAIQATNPGAKPGAVATASGSGRPGQNNLTPAAPVPSKVPANSAEDIRDIRHPRHLPTSIPWVVAAAGVLILSAAAFAIWRRIRGGRLLALTPHQLALRQLDAARQLMDPERARDYCFTVSEIIRNYVEARFRLQAPRLTTEEFLRDLVEVRETMLAAQRALLGDFLEHCDLAKFAGWRYSMRDLENMHHTAQEFVQQTVPAAAAPEPADRPLAPASSAILIRPRDRRHGGTPLPGPLPCCRGEGEASPVPGVVYAGDSSVT